MYKDPDAPEYFEVLLKYLKAAVKKDSFTKLQEIIMKVMKEDKDEMFSELEFIFRDKIRKEVQEATQENEQKAIKKGIRKGKIEGKREGIEEEKGIERHQIAENMVSMNMDNETIRQATGLSLRKIKEIRRDCKNH